MNKLSIKEFHRFMRGRFKDSIEHAFEKHHIFCEGDLQSFAWHKISSYLSSHEETPGKFRVLNKPYLRDCRTYPDLVVFRKTIPWVVVELKESKTMKEKSAEKEREKLLHAKKLLHARRGYLVYVARYGSKHAISGPKGDGGRFFFEIPIVLERSMTKEKITEWAEEFRPWAKYVLNSGPSASRKGTKSTK